jgi:hypothetical protein
MLREVLLTSRKALLMWCEALLILRETPCMLREILLMWRKALALLMLDKALLI